MGNTHINNYEDGDASDEGEYVVTGTRISEEDEDENPLLTHARKVYSPQSFVVFEHEYKKSLPLFADVEDEDSYDAIEYKVEKFDDSYKVIAEPISGKVYCSCNYYSFTGILCSHALAILQRLHFKEIPEHHLLKWRMKSGLNVQSDENSKQKRFSFDDCLYNKLIRTYGKYEKDFEHKDEGYMDKADVSAPLLSHAKEIYLQKFATMFKEEYKKSEYLMTDCKSKVMHNEQIVIEYEVFKPRCYSEAQIVRAEANNGTVNCTCKMFEHTGILCSHALAVLTSLYLEKIPSRYICKKFLKDGTISNMEDEHELLSSKVVDLFLYDQLKKIYLDLQYMPGQRLLFEKCRGEISAILERRRESRYKEGNNHVEKLELKKAVRFCDEQGLKNTVCKIFKRRRKMPFHILQKQFLPSPAIH